MKLTALLKSAADTGVFVMIFPPRHNSLLNGTSLFISWFIGAFLIRHGTRRALRYGVGHGWEPAREGSAPGASRAEGPQVGALLFCCGPGRGVVSFWIGLRV